MSFGNDWKQFLNCWFCQLAIKLCHTKYYNFGFKYWRNFTVLVYMCSSFNFFFSSPFFTNNLLHAKTFLANYIKWMVMFFIWIDSQIFHTIVSTYPKRIVPSMPFRMGPLKTNNDFPHCSNAMISGMVTHTTCKRAINRSTYWFVQSQWKFECSPNLCFVCWTPLLTPPSLLDICSNINYDLSFSSPNKVVMNKMFSYQW